MPPNERVAVRVRVDLPAFDPASAFASLAKGRPQAFLIERGGWAGEPESACLGWKPIADYRLLDGRCRPARGAGKGGSPLERLGRALAGLGRASSGPAWAGGAVGYLAYEAVRHLEPIPARPGLREEGLVLVFEEALTHDFRSGRTELVAWVRPARARATRARLEGEAKRIAALLSVCPLPVAGDLRSEAGGGVEGWGEGKNLGNGIQGALGKPAFLSAVRKLKEHIRAGDIFQCVLSEQFRVRASVDPLTLYRGLRRNNPSPYHFLIRDGGVSYVGSSPERLVRVEGRRALYNPIAGTRPRGATPGEDRALERALKASPKERAEHLMLVDLGRNDLGRVCVPGTVRVARYMDVRRFSRVMHLVSELEGRLEPGRSSWDALLAAFPAGTVTGAPKVRAMQLLAELEPKARGFYSGTVLQRDWLGNLDSCIALRSAQVERRQVVLQAGAGIVADSSPEREYAEVQHKLEAGRRALAAALGALR